VLGVVADDLELVAARQPRAHLRELRPERVDHGHRVGAGLPADREDHGRLAVDVGGRLHLFGAVLDDSDVAQADVNAGPRGDDHVLELLHGGTRPFIRTVSSRGPLADAAAGQLEVLVLDRARPTSAAVRL
jgi:hypothetical protein